MPNERMTKRWGREDHVCRQARNGFGIRDSSFFRHSCFELRHLFVRLATSPSVGYNSIMPPEFELNYLPRLPRDKTPGIGCVGAGFIMRDCHLVAYRQAGFNPVASTSRHVERARAVAQQHGIPRCHDTLADLLNDPAVAVLDIAVP